MAKKQLFYLFDTETTIKDHICDYAAIVVDRKGIIHAETAIIIKDFQHEELFHDVSNDGLWSKRNLEKRHENYANMLNTGQRMLASTQAINRWNDKVLAKWPDITLTAYNVAFDLDKAQKSGVDLSGFTDRFCLWHAACGHFASTKEYRRFVLANHAFNAPTKKTNSMSFQTNAEIMASFVNGSMLPPEPHTAREDLVYENMILQKIINRRNWRDKITPYSYHKYQVRDNFTV